MAENVPNLHVPYIIAQMFTSHRPFGVWVFVTQEEHDAIVLEKQRLQQLPAEHTDMHQRILDAQAARRLEQYPSTTQRRSP